jgi:hypothetical protein
MKLFFRNIALREIKGEWSEMYLKSIFVTENDGTNIIEFNSVEIG